MKTYKYKAYLPDTNQKIVAFLKEGVGIRGIARLLQISPVTVIARIKLIASQIEKPPVPMHKTFELDELKTYIKRKTNEMWVIYAIENETRNVVDIKVGKRSKKNLQKVAQTLVLSEAKTIFTDKLEIYKHIIPKEIHKTKIHSINHIERKNLSLRTHLKRLNRKTICYSKSLLMLVACVKIYFWL